MTYSVNWLALSVKSLKSTAAFYHDTLGLPIRQRSDTEWAVTAGSAAILLRRHDHHSRGGDHVHYAFETGAAAVDRWRDRLAEYGPVHEHDFGHYRSLYFFDPAGHCVEIGGRKTRSEEITSIFEIVLEVRELEPATVFYETLGFKIKSTGENRRRVRLDGGEVELELWEPHTGIAGARPGRHVDLGLSTTDVHAIRRRLGLLDNQSEGKQTTTFTDRDNHRITLLASSLTR